MVERGKWFGQYSSFFRLREKEWFEITNLKSQNLIRLVSTFAQHLYLVLAIAIVFAKFNFASCIQVARVAFVSIDVDF